MINIVVAMPCEAKPLVEHFALQRNSQLHAFPVYASTDMTLITSGVGKVNSAMAVAWLAGQQQTRDQQWLNIGMAGHASHKPGTLLVANKVTDMATNRSWYPQVLSRLEHESTALRTIDAVAADYPPDAMIDMEGAGFMEAAEKFSTLENIQLLKIISDTCHAPAQHVTKTLIDNILRNQLPVLARLIHALQTASGSPAAEDITIKRVMHLCLQNRHFSQYQQTHLKKLLQRLQALNLLDDITPASLQACSSGKAVIQQLETLLARQVYHVTGS